MKEFFQSIGILTFKLISLIEVFFKNCQYKGKYVLNPENSFPMAEKYKQELKSRRKENKTTQGMQKPLTI